MAHAILQRDVRGPKAGQRLPRGQGGQGGQGAGGAGGGEFIPPNQTNSTTEDSNITGGGGGGTIVYVPAPIEQDQGLSKLNSSDLKWKITPIRSDFARVQVYYALPNTYREGSFRLTNLEARAIRLERSCLGTYCDYVEFDNNSINLTLQSLDNKKVHFRFNTAGTKFGDQRNFTNVMTDNNGSQNILRVEIVISRLAYLAIYFVQIIIALLFAIIGWIGAVILTNYVFPRTDKSMKYLLQIGTSAIVLIMSLIILIQ